MNQTLKYAMSNLDLNEEMKKAVALAEMTYEQLGLPELSQRTNIEFNNRFISLAGRAKLNRIYKRQAHGTLGDTIVSSDFNGKIWLGTKYFVVASEDDKVETVVHEACHIANQYLSCIDRDWLFNDYGSKKSKGHGHGWKHLMKKVGYPNASQYHCINTTQFKTYYQYDCNKCNNSGRLTANLAGRIRNGTGLYGCHKCRTPIRFSSLKKIDGSNLVYADT